jgi:hypothetical protein
MNAKPKPAPQPSAIKSVNYYVASPVECCDRCSQGIKHVFSVSLKDGTQFKYGSECINKILANDTSLKGLWRKNSKRLMELKRHLEILSRPLEQIPTHQEYYHSGIYIITDEDGKIINGSKTSSCIFHPNVDIDRCMASDYGKNTSTTGLIGKSSTAESLHAKFSAGIEEAKKFIKGEIDRIEPFLARILAKGLVTESQK